VTARRERSERARPATREDMRRFWPDLTEEELAAAWAAIESAGATMTVLVTPPDDSELPNA